MESQTTNPPRILIVDDQRDVTTIIGRLLAKRGYLTYTVNDSREALQAARDFHPAAVILDISMPHVDGYEVAKQVRGEPGLVGVPIIACTTLRSGHHQERARMAGFTHHLPKPCDLRELEALLGGLQLRR